MQTCVPTCRNVLHLDLNAIPTVACPPTGADANRELEVRLRAVLSVRNVKDEQATNSWILDFMIHGQRKYLWEEPCCSLLRASGDNRMFLNEGQRHQCHSCMEAD